MGGDPEDHVEVEIKAPSVEVKVKAPSVDTEAQPAGGNTTGEVAAAAPSKTAPSKTATKKNANKLKADKPKESANSKVKEQVVLKTYLENQLANELGLDAPSIHFSAENGNMLEQFVVDATPIRQDKIDPEAAEANLAAGADAEEPVEVTAETATPAQLKHRDDVAAARYARIETVDKAALGLQPIGRVEADHWIKKVLLEGEEEMFRLPTIGFFGMPGKPSELTKGYGMLLLTKIGDSHRLHYLSQSETSKLNMSETWDYDNETEYAGDAVTASKTSVMIDTEVNASRSNLITTANLNIDGNLFHCHGSLEDKSEIVEQLKGGYKQEYECCACLNCPGCETCKCCMLWCLLFPCMVCSKCCSNCCKTTTAHESGTWGASGEYNVIAETSFISEETQDDYAMKLPEWDPLNEVPIISGIRVQASKVDLHHMIHLTYRESSTDTIESSSILLAKDADVDLVTMFVSQMGLFCTAPCSDREYKTVSMPTRMSAWPKSVGSVMTTSGSGKSSGGFGTEEGEAGEVSCLWALTCAYGMYRLMDRKFTAQVCIAIIFTMAFYVPGIIFTAIMILMYSKKADRNKPCCLCIQCFDPATGEPSIGCCV